MNCTRCRGTGFLNIHQAPEAVADGGVDAIQEWMKDETEPHDVCICDCCGDGEEWFGEPGQHYTSRDPVGKAGPYAYNGGLAECN